MSTGLQETPTGFSRVRFLGFPEVVYRFLTFSFALLEGNGADALGHQVTPAGEASGPSHFWLIRSQGTQQTGDEAVMGILTR